MIIDPPASDFTRIAAINDVLCRCENRLDLPVVPSVSLADRIERLARAGGIGRLKPKHYRLICLLRDKLAEQAAKQVP